SGDKLAYLVLALVAERAIQQLLTGGFLLSHAQPSSERDVRTLSINPYDTASSADMKLSRSVSTSMRSIGWPVRSDRMRFRRDRRSRISRAWIWISVACPCAPPEG